MKDLSRFADRYDELYYPIGTVEDNALERRYQARAEAEVNVRFAGRLGTYRYLDMHQAIGVALKKVPAVHGWIASGRMSPLGDWMTECFPGICRVSR